MPSPSARTQPRGNVHCTPIARERIYEIVGQRARIIASHLGAYEINPSPYNLKNKESQCLPRCFQDLFHDKF